MWDIPLVIKSLPENFKFKTFWDLVPRFLRLWFSDCLFLLYLHFTITRYHFFIPWQVCKPQEIPFTLVNSKALHSFSFKTSTSWLYLFYCTENSLQLCTLIGLPWSKFGNTELTLSFQGEFIKLFLQIN